MTERAQRWSIEDNTSSNKGFCKLLLDGRDIGIDIFPFRRGIDHGAVKRRAASIVEVLNAAHYWRYGGDGLGPERLEDAVDALHRDGESGSTSNKED